MGQEPTPTPAEGQEPAAPSEGQEPQGEAPKPSGFDALPPETQAEIKKLRAEAAQYRTKAQEYEDAQKSEVQKAETKAQRAEAAKAEAEAKLLRYEVANEKEVPAKLFPLLTASTRDELEAQAALILETAKPAAPDFDGGPREPAPEPTAPDAQHNELVSALLGRSSNT